MKNHETKSREAVQDFWMKLANGDGDNSSPQERRERKAALDAAQAKAHGLLTRSVRQKKGKLRYLV